jgi:ubiquitin-conjugating enzyme E2 H
MAWKRRISRDIKDLIDSGFKVTGENNAEEYTLNSFLTTVTGPPDTPYEGCVWNVRFTITEGFPFSSPSVGFAQRIYHPNVDEESGSICLDTLNKAWSPTFTIRHIVEVVLPYLLSYPNPDDPLNRDAAHLLKTNKDAFDVRAKAHSRSNCLKQI